MTEENKNKYNKTARNYGLVETGMNLNVLTRTMKIFLSTMDPASGPLFRHGGTGKLIVF
jgi:hypothetical protein